MKIGILSDTHDQMSYLEQAVQIFNEQPGQSYSSRQSILNEVKGLSTKGTYRRDCLTAYIEKREIGRDR